MSDPKCIWAGHPAWRWADLGPNWLMNSDQLKALDIGHAIDPVCNLESVQLILGC